MGLGIEGFVPFGEVAEAGAQGGAGLEGEVAFKGGGVGIGGGDVAGLHGDELFVGLEVVILGEHLGADQFLLEDVNKVQQVLGLVVADVIHSIGWHGESVVACLF